MGIRKLRCSFCRKTEDQIAKLVAGPRSFTGSKIYICNECVAVANSVMQAGPPTARVASYSLLKKAKAYWGRFLHGCMVRRASIAHAV